MPEQNYLTRRGEQGSVHVAEEVIATIVHEAVREVEGVGGMARVRGGGEGGERLSKHAASRGVRIAIAENEAVVEVFILVAYGTVIAEVAGAVQEAVASALEAITGLSVKTVHVTVCGIQFDKPKSK